MADPANYEDRVAAFLKHLVNNDDDRLEFQNGVLGQIVEIARVQGYEFPIEALANVAGLQIRWQAFGFWFPPHGGGK